MGLVIKLGNLVMTSDATEIEVISALPNFSAIHRTEPTAQCPACKKSVWIRKHQTGYLFIHDRPECPAFANEAEQRGGIKIKSTEARTNE